MQVLSNVLIVQFLFKVLVFSTVSTDAAQQQQQGVVPNTRAVLQSQYPSMNSDPSSPRWTASQITANCTDLSPLVTAPPNNNQTNAVDTLFSVERLVDISTNEEMITVTGVMYLHWTVSTCSADELDLGSGDVVDPEQRIFTNSPNEFWLPTFVFSSSATDIYMKGSYYGDHLLATVQRPVPNQSPAINFYHTRRGFFSSSCNLDMAKFPFDRQVCYFVFTLGQASSQVRFFNPSVLCPQDESTEWRFSDCSLVSNSDVRKQGIFVNTVNFSVTLIRKPSFYVVNLAVPSLILSILELATFLLPPHVPDRPIFAVTILLALTVAQSDVLKDVPRTSQHILLGDYIAYLSWFCAVCTAYELLSCFLASRDQDKEQKTVTWCGKTMSRARAIDIVVFVVSCLAFGAIHAVTAIVGFK